MNTRVKHYDPAVADAAVDNCIAGLDAMDEPPRQEAAQCPELSTKWDKIRFVLTLFGLVLFCTAALYARPLWFWIFDFLFDAGV